MLLVGLKILDILNLSMLGNFFVLFLSSVDFSKLTLKKKSFRNTIKVSNGLGPHQD